MSKGKYSRDDSDIHTGTLRLPAGYSLPQLTHSDSFTSTRTANYRDKEIRVETTYRITIDGEPVKSHVMVGNDGMVHSHGLPNYSFSSALDLARGLIDAGDVDLPENELSTPLDKGN